MGTAALPSKPQRSPERTRLIQRIHVLRRELRLADDEYRALILRVTGYTSSGLLDVPGLKVWAGHLQGLKNRYRKPKRSYTLSPQEKKIWSQWQQLADAGKIKNRTMAGLMGYVRTHIAAVDHISWLNGAQQDLLIEQLKKFLDR